MGKAAEAGAATKGNRAERVFVYFSHGRVLFTTTTTSPLKTTSMCEHARTPPVINLVSVHIYFILFRMLQC